MNTLISIRSNILYAKKVKKDKNKPDEFIRHYELVLLVEKPKYSFSNESEIIRERSLEELRFMVSESVLANLAKSLLKMKDIDETDPEADEQIA